MKDEQPIKFEELVETVFSDLFLDYGFSYNGKSEWDGREYKIVAIKKDIELVFHIGIMPRKMYTVSLGIGLSGKLGEAATDDPKYRGIGITAIAGCLDPNYKRSLKLPSSNEEIIDTLTSRKEDLLTYCAEILNGDVSNWKNIVKCFKK